jgi:hypothetical protein
MRDVGQERNVLSGRDGEMTSEVITVFFYGVFMDESLLASKEISPSKATVGYTNDYCLRIGRRATERQNVVQAWEERARWPSSRHPDRAPFPEFRTLVGGVPLERGAGHCWRRRIADLGSAFC